MSYKRDPDLEFKPRTIREATYRQNGCCALCNQSFKELEASWYETAEKTTPEAHHVVPAQAAGTEWAKNVEITGVDNCVMLCPSCHGASHAGDFRDGAMRETFPGSQQNTGAHSGVEFLGGDSEVLDSSAGRQAYFKKFDLPSDASLNDLNEKLRESHSKQPTRTSRKVAEIDRAHSAKYAQAAPQADKSPRATCFGSGTRGTGGPENPPSSSRNPRTAEGPSAAVRPAIRSSKSRGSLRELTFGMSWLAPRSNGPPSP